MEVNPRLQVEHTVTEEVAGIDLVQLQLRLAAGSRLDDEPLPHAIPPHGMAMQLPINMDRLQADASIAPSAGVLGRFDLPSGPGVRVDTAGYAGFRNSVSFDSLLAKLIVRVPSNDYPALVRKAYRALCETQIQGIATNLQFLRSLLRNPDVADNRVHTRFIDDHIREIVEAEGEAHPLLHFAGTSSEDNPAALRWIGCGDDAGGMPCRRAPCAAGRSRRGRSIAGRHRIDEDGIRRPGRMRRNGGGRGCGSGGCSA
jgi:pyruvate carboxylase